MNIREAGEADLPAILAIHNDAVLNTSAIWDDTPVDLANREAWFAARQAAGYPVLACEENGVLLGYASFGDFRQWSGYRLTVEHSVYVAKEHRRRGAARLLLEALIDRARTLGKHVMVGGIEAGNAASIALHARLGFEVTGNLRQVGVKFGRWLDLVMMQRLLDEASEPPAVATPSALQIRAADFGDPRVIELLATHVATARAQTAEGSAHAFDVENLRRPGLSVWTAWRGNDLLGVGALMRLSAIEGEIKSMHTAATARRAGIGHAMLTHIVAVARAEGLTRLSLETGSWPYFDPARAMYAAHGFVECEPFGAYVADPNSVFMTRTFG
jgi:L-amino acid N-acyltransferase YncA/N-acetylglutamate synthase-like GNAT family acetyltransferase